MSQSSINHFLKLASNHFQQAIESIPDRLGSNFQQAIELIQQTTGHLICCGMGKSGLIANKLAATFASTGTPAFFMHPGEALHGDLGMITAEDSLLLISNSGETAELSAIIPSIQGFGNRIIAMTGKPESRLAQAADVVLSTHIDRELCPHNLAPTTSTLVTLAIGDLLAVRLMNEANFNEKDFARFHPGGSLGRRLLMQVKDLMHPLPLPVVSQKTLIKDALIVMSEGRLGLTLVRHRHSLAGIFTDGDLRRSLLHSDQALEQPCQAFMTQTPVVIQQQASLIEAEQKISNTGVNALIVTSSMPLADKPIPMAAIVGVFEKLV